MSKCDQRKQNPSHSKSSPKNLIRSQALMSSESIFSEPCLWSFLSETSLDDQDKLQVCQRSRVREAADVCGLRLCTGTFPFPCYLWIDLWFSYLKQKKYAMHRTIFCFHVHWTWSWFSFRLLDLGATGAVVWFGTGGRILEKIKWLGGISDFPLVSIGL